MVGTEHFLQEIASLELKEAISVSQDDNIKTAVDLMKKSYRGAVIVKDLNDGALIGIVTERDLIFKYDIILNNSKTRVSEVMETQSIFLNENSSIAEAISIISNKEIRQLPIICEDGVIKIISIRNILSFIYELSSDLLVNIKPTTDWGKKSINLGDLELVAPKNNVKNENFLDIPLRRIYSTRLSFLSDKLTIREALENFRENKHFVGMILHYETEILGIVTERDFCFKVFTGEFGPDDLVINIMTRDPHLLSKEHKFSHALKNMCNFQYRNVPVVNDECFPIGNISLLELLIFFANSLGLRNFKPK